MWNLIFDRKFPVFIIIMIVLFSCSGIAVAQTNEAERSDVIKHSIQAGGKIDVYTVNGQRAILAGIEGGWIFTINRKHSLGIIPSIKRIANRIEVQQNNFGDTLYLDFSTIGVNFMYTFSDHDHISFSMSNEISTGISNYHFGNFRADMHSGYMIFMLEPGVHLNWAFTNYFTVSTGITYKLTSSSDHFLISSKQLSGLAGTMRITFKKSL
jgi:hypothetical protein